MFRLRFAISAVVVAAAMLMPVASAAADGGPLIVACLGTTTTTYEPPLKNEPQTIIRTTEATLLCVPLLGLPIVFGGTRSNVVTSVQQCPPLTDPISLPGESGSLTYLFMWSNNNPPNSSTVVSNGVVSTRPTGERITTRAGEVIAGRYQGYDFLQVTDGVTPDLTACFGAGISETIGTDTVTFTNVL